MIESKFEVIQSQVDQMLNNFQVDLVRQFEIQKTVVDNLIAGYLIDESD